MFELLNFIKKETPKMEDGGCVVPDINQQLEESGAFKSLAIAHYNSGMDDMALHRLNEQGGTLGSIPEEDFELLKHGIDTFSFLLPPPVNKKHTLAELAKLIKETYSIENPKTLAVYDAMIKYGDVEITKKYEYGGDVEPDEAFAVKQLTKIHDYAEAASAMLKDDTKLEAWLQGLVSKSEQMISDVKHSLQADFPSRFMNGGEIDEPGKYVKSELLHIGNYARKLIAAIEDEAGGVRLGPWMKANISVVSNYIGVVRHYLEFALDKVTFETGGLPGGFSGRDREHINAVEVPAYDDMQKTEFATGGQITRYKKGEKFYDEMGNEYIYAYYSKDVRGGGHYLKDMKNRGILVFGGEKKLSGIYHKLNPVLKNDGGDVDDKQYEEYASAVSSLGIEVNPTCKNKDYAVRALVRLSNMVPSPEKDFRVKLLTNAVLDEKDRFDATVEEARISGALGSFATGFTNSFYALNLFDEAKKKPLDKFYGYLQRAYQIKKYYDGGDVDAPTDGANLRWRDDNFMKEEDLPFAEGGKVASVTKRQIEKIYSVAGIVIDKIIRAKLDGGDGWYVYYKGASSVGKASGVPSDFIPDDEDYVDFIRMNLVSARLRAGMPKLGIGELDQILLDAGIPKTKLSEGGTVADEMSMVVQGTVQWADDLPAFEAPVKVIFKIVPPQYYYKRGRNIVGVSDSLAEDYKREGKKLLLTPPEIKVDKIQYENILDTKEKVWWNPEPSTDIVLDGETKKLIRERLDELNAKLEVSQLEDGGKVNLDEIPYLQKFIVHDILIKPHHAHRDEYDLLIDYLNANSWLYRDEIAPNGELPYLIVSTKNVSRGDVEELKEFLYNESWDYSDGKYADGGEIPATDIEVGAWVSGKHYEPKPIDGELELPTDGNNLRWWDETVQGLPSDVEKVLEDGGKVGGAAKTARVLIISGKNPLSKQLQKITGDSLNKIDFEDLEINPGVGSGVSLTKHKATGQLFAVFSATYYDQVDAAVIKSDLSYLGQKFGITDFIGNVKKETGGDLGQSPEYAEGGVVEGNYEYIDNDGTVTVKKLVPNRPGETEWKRLFFSMDDAKEYVSVEEQLGMIDDSKLKLKEYKSKFRDNPNADWLKGEYYDGKDTNYAGVALELYPNREQAIHEIKWSIVYHILKEKAKDKLADGGKVEHGVMRYKAGDKVYVFVHHSDPSRWSHKPRKKELEEYNKVAPAYIVGEGGSRQAWCKVEIIRPISDEQGWERYMVKLLEGYREGADRKGEFVASQSQMSKQNKKPIAIGYSDPDNMAEGGKVDINETLAGGSECVGWMEKFQGMDTSTIDVEAFAGGGGVYTPKHYSPEEWEMFRKEFNETFSKRDGLIHPADEKEREYYVSSAFPENKIHKLGKVWWISNYAHAGFGRSEYPTLAKAKDELYTKYRANIGEEKGYESGGSVSVANKKHLDDLYKQAGSVDAAMQLYASELEIFGIYFGHKVDPNKKRKWSAAYDYLNKTKHGFVIFVTPKGGGFKPHVWIEGGKFDYENFAESQAKQLRKMRDLYKKVEIIPVTDERAVATVAKMEEGGILENLQSGEAENPDGDWLEDKFARGGGIHADRTLSFDKADYEKLIGTGKFYADEIGGEHYIHELPKSKTKIKANALGAWANGKLKLSEKEITPLAAWIVEEKYFDGTINPLYSKGDLVRPIIGGELYEPGEILSRSRERELGHNMYEVKMYDTVKNDGSWQPHWFMEGILLPIPRNASQTVKFKPIIDAIERANKFLNTLGYEVSNSAVNRRSMDVKNPKLRN